MIQFKAAPTAPIQTIAKPTRQTNALGDFDVQLRLSHTEKPYETQKIANPVIPLIITKRSNAPPSSPNMTKTPRYAYCFSRSIDRIDEMDHIDGYVAYQD